MNNWLLLIVGQWANKTVTLDFLTSAVMSQRQTLAVWRHGKAATDFTGKKKNWHSQGSVHRSIKVCVCKGGGVLKSVPAEAHVGPQLR